MAAAIFKAVMIFVGLESKKTFPVVAAFTDVNAAAVTWGATSDSSYILNEDSIWVDALVNTGGTDTSQSALYLNDAATPITFIHKANLDTAASGRQMQMLRLKLRKGTKIKMVQAT